MCRPTSCKECGKTTWTGCGRHVAQVKAKVPPEQWCPGHGESEATRRTGLLRGLFGR